MLGDIQVQRKTTLFDYIAKFVGLAIIVIVSTNWFFSGRETYQIKSRNTLPSPSTAQQESTDYKHLSIMYQHKMPSLTVRICHKPI